MTFKRPNNIMFANTHKPKKGRTNERTPRESTLSKQTAKDKSVTIAKDDIHRGNQQHQQQQKRRSINCDVMKLSSKYLIFNIFFCSAEFS